MTKSLKPAADATSEVYADPALATMTPDGIEGYYWPISHQDILTFGQNLEQALAKFLRDYPDQQEILPYKIAAKNFVTSICACFQGELLRHRFAQDSAQLHLAQDWQVWGPIFAGQAPPMPGYLQALQTPQKPPTLFQRLLNPANFLRALKKVRLTQAAAPQIDGLFIGKPAQDKLQDVIVTTQRLALIARHAEETEKPVYLCSSLLWFSALQEDECSAELASANTLIDQQILSMIESAYSAFDLQIMAANKAYLQHILQHFVAMIKIHLRGLTQRSDMPAFLWTGSGGHIWDVMLRCEVKRRGGSVIAHDHGGGIPHLDHPEKGWVELWSCDEFIMYSAEQAKTFKMFMHSWPNLDKDLPEIRSLPKKENKAAFITYDKFLEDKPEIKKIRLFSTLYSSEEGRGFPLFPHIAYVDWHARVLSRLKQSGYEVSLKPHPESRIKAPSSFRSVLGFDVIEKSLEGMGEDFDVYIFDLSNTSVFETALMTNKPVIVIDFGVMNWRPDAFDLLKTRCGYVKGFYQGSRMCVHWDELLDQIQAAALISNNREFAQTYYF